ncbi:unnamed protein product [Clonostachys rhizophaga]|uniref:Uncharacterized protein n=1 Tax=Clonostachys rhizophaga TaxID=160324 RepID=A0A9N9VKY0_9HYPO|nr:unnamed protein product [Clonostachys rhizophaga]
MLFFLKKQPRGHLSSLRHYNRMIALINKLLYYAREAKKHPYCRHSEVSPVEDILDTADRTHMRDPPRSRGLDKYHERGNCNFLALAIQARLFKYIRSKLKADPRRLAKPGRPLLDYTLRPRRVTPLALPYYSRRDEPNIEPEIISLLLSLGAKPNQVVHSHEDRTVWALFLISCWESAKRGEATEVSKKTWYEVSEMMIKHGSSRDCFNSIEGQELSIDDVLNTIFGEDQASNLLEQINDQMLHKGNPWSGWISSFF